MRPYSYLGGTTINIAMLVTDYCPVERTKNAKVECSYDGERWIWVIRITERDAKKMGMK